MTHSAEWEADCLRWRGKVLTGEHGHWCPDYDFLPIDETCANEWPCPCQVGDAGRSPPEPKVAA
jgi:hypothetical protein